MNQVDQSSASHLAPAFEVARDYEQPDPIVDLGKLATTLWRQRWAIVRIATLVAFAAVVAHILLPSRYVSTTEILIDPRGLKVVDKDVAPQSDTTDTSIAVVESQMQVLKSDSVLRRTVKSQGLAKDEEFGARTGFLSPLTDIVKALLGRGEKATDRELRAMRLLWDAVDVKRAPESYVLRLSVVTRDPQKSARIAASIAASYIDSEFAARATLARRAASSLTERLDALQRKVRVAEDRVEAFKAKKNIVNAEGRLVNEQQLKELNSDLVRAREATAKARARLDQINALRRSGASPDAIAEAIQSQTIKELRVRYSAAREREEALSAALMPAHPTLKRARAQTAAVRREINTELGRIAASARLDLDRARESEALTKSNLDGLMKKALSTNETLVRLRELERDAEANRQVYESWLVRAREIREQQTVDNTSARIISPATPPSEPKGLSLPLLAILAFAGGLGLGSVITLVRETTDQTLRDVHQLRGESPVPVLAVVSDIPRGRAVDGRESSRRLEGYLPAFVTAAPSSQASMTIGYLREMLIPRARLLGPQSILVTASSHDEGKSTLALNLALSAAVRGDKVLLIDADLSLRFLTLARVGKARKGLVQVAEGQTEFADAICDDPSNLIKILPAARVDGAPSALLRPVALRKQIIGSAHDFDLIVIDGGPIVADYATRALAEIVDDIVLVGLIGKTRRDKLAELIETLRPHALKVRGIVALDG